MTRDESQLRAALRQGEDASPAPDGGAIITRAVRRRDDRRRRLLSVAGSVVVVAAVIGGVTALITSGPSPQAGPELGTNEPPRSVVVGPSPVPKAISAALDARCPASPVEYALPGGGGIGRFGSTQPLFTTSGGTTTVRVAAARVCAYPADTTTLTRADASRVLGPDAAGSLARELDRAPARAGSRPADCTAGAPDAMLEVLAFDRDGSSLPPVLVTVRCAVGASVTATNGTAVRYSDTVPAALRPLVVNRYAGPFRRASTAPASISPAPDEPTVGGSPVH